jgi:F-type H+-transporting ATPase subunit delta
MPLESRDAGRTSYAVAVERLEVLARGERPVPLAGVAEEILAVSDLLERQPRLRRALSDPARPGADRAELLGSLVQGKVAPDTESLLRTLVDGRWSSSSNLLDATERLGIEALLASADSAGELADVEDELFRFGQVVDGDPQLAGVLGSSTVPSERRSDLAHNLLEGKAKAATVRLVDVALHGFGGRGFAAALTRLVELAAARRERQIAYVTAAVALSDADEARLAARLSELYGRPVEVKVTVSPEILGGASVQVGHDLYDGTILRRLNAARAALAGNR